MQEKLHLPLPDSSGLSVACGGAGSAPGPLLDQQRAGVWHERDHSVNLVLVPSTLKYESLLHRCHSSEAQLVHGTQRRLQPYVVKVVFFVLDDRLVRSSMSHVALQFINQSITHIQQSS